MVSKKKTKKNARGPSPNITDAQKRAFLDTLRKGHSVSASARVARFDRSNAYRMQEADVEFAAAWEVAIQEGTDVLEDEAHRRAVLGTLDPVFYKGKKIGNRVEYSDTLIVFLLKARRPDKYREQVNFRHSGNDASADDGGPINALLRSIDGLGRHLPGTERHAKGG